MRRGVVALIVLCLAGAACASPSERYIEPRPAGGGASFGGEDVTFGSSLAQIRGHQLVSLRLYRLGDSEGALIHAGHPVAELYEGIRGELESVRASALSGALKSALDAGAAAIHERRSARELAAAGARLRRLTERAAAVVVGDASEGVPYRASVVADLLAVAASEYEEALGPSGIRLEGEYQNAYGFAREARAMYRRLAREVEVASRREAEEVGRAFARLFRALPSPRPPRKPAALDDVAVATGLVGRELETTVDARIDAEPSPKDVEERIRALLDAVVESYRAGDPAEAAELAAEAYLDNYEGIEGAVIDHAPDVNAELEPLLGAQLRNRIREGAPVQEVAALARRARGLLHDAVGALEQADSHS